MNRTYLVVPTIALATFAAFYFHARPALSAHANAPAPVDAFAGRDGRQEAEREAAAGKLVLIETGPGVSWDAERREIARQRYGVELRRSDEAATESFARYVDGFNRVMRPRIVAQHGRGFFDTLHREAIALHERRGAPGTTADPSGAPTTTPGK